MFKRFLKEFREFISRGNAIDLAIGIIIGGAFKGITDSLINDIIMPVISVFSGGTDFSHLFIPLDGKAYSSLAEAKAAGAATFNYGSFITVVLNFFIMAFVIFLLVKGINLVKRTFVKDTVTASVTKECSFCRMKIHPAATRCPHCTSLISVEE